LGWLAQSAAAPSARRREKLPLIGEPISLPHKERIWFFVGTDPELSS
jgi:hypothetical protein